MLLLRIVLWIVTRSPGPRLDVRESMENRVLARLFATIQQNQAALTRTDRYQGDGLSMEQIEQLLICQHLHRLAGRLHDFNIRVRGCNKNHFGLRNG